MQDAIAGADLLIKNMLPPQLTLKALCYFDDVDISEDDKKCIVNACREFDTPTYDESLKGTVFLFSKTLYRNENDAEQPEKEDDGGEEENRGPCP